MRKKTMIIGGAAAAAVLLLGGTGVAYAATDGFEFDGSDDRAGGPGAVKTVDPSEVLTGADLDRASEVALAEIDGGSVVTAERDDDGFELELRADDGRYWEVDLDAAFAVVKVELDDDVVTPAPAPTPASTTAP
ncbi:PepSY domain-containing protein [Herbiconiux sp. A18JL235]|uniref:PepSY domain-containing protein n=1 Tax=Herbiconiux sp. A18JL235 TaxID=3152363 RepID=A0AB39BIE1_9MICO